jgi:ribosome biogenesis GTPase A
LADETHPLGVAQASAGASLGNLIANAITAARQGKLEMREVDQLAALAERLAALRLQIAVVGQFKRGKSTLMNGLIGLDVMPTGVVPVTAIATKVEASPSFTLSVELQNGATSAWTGGDADDLRDQLRHYVTEAGNPKNRLGVASAAISVPSDLLADGIVLIDTPGVGSTLRHNTEAAESALADCDAAIFVVSPDPPMTETEAGYLKQVAREAARIFIVLNKSDLLSPGERAEAEAYLRRTARDVLSDVEPTLFVVSARQALQAKQDGNQAALVASGLPVLEAALTGLMGGERVATLEAAIAGKAAGVARALLFQTRVTLQALRLPVADLASRLGRLDQITNGLDDVRLATRDVLAGDERRLLEEIDERAKEQRERAARILRTTIGRGEATGLDKAEAWLKARGEIDGLFNAELDASTAIVSQRLAERFEAHQARLGELLDATRAATAEILEVPLWAPAPAPRFEMRRAPYWVENWNISLSPFTPGAFEKYMPPAWRAGATARRVERDMAAIVTRNVENLRWALGQSVRDAFRSFSARLSSQLDAAAGDARTIVAEMLRLRAERENDARLALARAEQALADLTPLEAALSERGALNQEAR